MQSLAAQAKQSVAYTVEDLTLLTEVVHFCSSPQRLPDPELALKDKRSAQAFARVILTSQASNAPKTERQRRQSLHWLSGLRNLRRNCAGSRQRRFGGLNMNCFEAFGRCPGSEARIRSSMPSTAALQPFRGSKRIEAKVPKPGYPRRRIEADPPRCAASTTPVQGVHCPL